MRPGDRVALWGPNDPYWAVHAFGVWDAGAVIVPLSARYKGIEAAELIAQDRGRVLITGDGPDGTPTGRPAAAGPPGRALRRPARSLRELADAPG